MVILVLNLVLILSLNVILGLGILAVNRRISEISRLERLFWEDFKLKFNTELAEKIEELSEFADKLRLEKKGYDVY